ncbi:DUF159-domain-containing protein [Sodiomyces alkalinus F11]|uniref:DUF159-domain-containing protein n=1 Tax=Sodiomyces alkalinus (strain CBS 110278 / VKM F-3762 / F11) TaxID=1314773 RepID=A0A3N2PJX6_SODAK|nr:DUF159-domain-containing protein [Sodiomyces alkalinus F11]ROT34616.1 DUF159-domain-containing protein [Sodiomyces alkalinus F11]
MCGRYCLALRPSQIRQHLEDDDMVVDDGPIDEGPGAPRRSYNFAPGYNGAVYRADTPAHNVAGLPHNRMEDVTATEPWKQGQDIDASAPSAETSDESKGVTYKIQSMQWGIIPARPKRHPKYSKTLKLINCRDDSLSNPGGTWGSLKTRQRCIVIAEGFYEWLKTGHDKMPYFVRRKDRRLMYFAGLWECSQRDGSSHHHQNTDSDKQLFTYTIITTDSNDQLKFLHDRMPVVLEEGSREIRAWLDPARREWSRELQALLKPYTRDLECYPVSKEVGKVGNDSPSFVVPVDSKENRSNIANFFPKPTEAKGKSERSSHFRADEAQDGNQVSQTQWKSNACLKQDNWRELDEADFADDAENCARAGTKRSNTGFDTEDRRPKQAATTNETRNHQQSSSVSGYNLRQSDSRDRQPNSRKPGAMVLPEKDAQGKPEGQTSRTITDYFGRRS